MDATFWMVGAKIGVAALVVLFLILLVTIAVVTVFRWTMVEKPRRPFVKKEPYFKWDET